MKLAFILAANGGCWFNLRFLWALRRELQLTKFVPRVVRRAALIGPVAPRRVVLQQTKPYLVHSRLNPQMRTGTGAIMHDVIFVGITVVFYIISIAYVYACGRLR
jgi:hypothetical protein